MVNKSKYFFDILFLSLLTIFSFVWSSLLFRQWSTDYGNYYLMANLTRTNELYDVIFTHKGPVFFNLIALFSTIIDWGVFQSYLIYSFLSLFYLVSFYLLIRLYSHSQLTRFICVLLICSTLFLQNTNSIISFVMMSFVLFSYLNLELFKRNKSLLNLIVSYIALSLAILTRIDALIFLPLIFYIVVYREKKLFDAFLSVLLFVSILLILLNFFMLINKFSLTQFVEHNILFNLTYSSIGVNDSFKNFLKPIAVYLIITFPLIILHKKKYSHIVETSKNNNLFGVITLIILPLIFWMYSGSAKLSHLVIFLIPSIIYFISNLDFEKIAKNSKILLLVYYLIIFLMTSYPGLKSIKHFHEVKGIQMYSEEDKKIVNFLSNSNYEHLYLIGSRAWFYLFTNMKAKSSTNNWWFYLEPGFQTIGTLKMHQGYNDNPDETIIVIDKRILNSELNEYFYEIINNSFLHDFDTENFQFRSLNKID